VAQVPAIANGNSCHATLTRRLLIGDWARKTNNPVVYLLELARAGGIARWRILLLLVARLRRRVTLLRITPRLCAQNTEETVDDRRGGTQEAGALQKASTNRLACEAHQESDCAH